MSEEADWNLNQQTTKLVHKPSAEELFGSPIGPGDLTPPCTTVPNLFPTASAPYKIAFIGEAPGSDEISQGKPFVGFSGQLLTGLMSKLHIVRDFVFIGNICQYQPPKNEIAFFDWYGTEIQSGLAQLKEDLAKFQPHIIICLGNSALNAFINPTQKIWSYTRGGKTAFHFSHSVDAWRGSLFLAQEASPLPGAKCISSYHPAACLRDRSGIWRQMLFFDIAKTWGESLNPKLTLPERRLTTDYSATDLINRIQVIRNTKEAISIDIEGGVSLMPCCSVAVSSQYSFIVPFTNLDGSPYWTNKDDERRVYRAFAALMSDPTVPKILQNGLYDRFVLQYSYRIPVLGCVHDTMLKWWERYCELEKSLAVQASVLTKEPYYKSDRKTNDLQTFYRYCCKDSAITYEINSKLPESPHYRFNHDLLNPLLYMELRGVRYDHHLAASRSKEIEAAFHSLQARLDLLAGRGISPRIEDRPGILDLARTTMGFKRDPTIPKKAFEADYDRIIRILLGPADLTDQETGYINSTLGLSMNVKSRKKQAKQIDEDGNEKDEPYGAVWGYDPKTDDFRNFLYNHLNLPVQHKRAKNGLPGAVTCDYDALLKLSKWIERESRTSETKAANLQRAKAAISLSIDITELRTRLQMLQIRADPDGRIRCGYNKVGTPTGRITCYTSPTGSGYNLHTLPGDNMMKPKESALRQGMLDLCVADEGYFVAKCDLKGSDGWTIGAYLNMLGHSTMIDDLRSGIKPANRVCYMLRHGVDSLTGKTREEIKLLLKEVKKEDWDYFSSKIAIWGICYCMGPDLLADQILEESEGKVYLSRSDVAEFHNAVHHCYRPKLWWDWMNRKLKEKPVLSLYGGFERRFHGKPTENLGEALAHAPQYFTTYATDKALWNLWHDPDNRRVGFPPLKVEPLHHWHDALVLQWRIEDTDWAKIKIRQWFNNTLIIAGQEIVIPFDGSYGLNWNDGSKGSI